MGTPKALRLARNRWSSVRPPGRARSTSARGRSYGGTISAESFRRKLALFAVCQATAILILAAWRLYTVAPAWHRGTFWSVACLGPPVLGAAAAAFVTLWKIAERLSLPAASLSRRPDAIRALTGQHERRARSAAKSDESKEPSPPV